MLRILTFEIGRTDGEAASLMPCIDGTRLADLVADFERENGHDDPAGGYGGIVPSYYDLGPLPSYFLWKEGPVEGVRAGEIFVLFCECGEAGCWPLVAHVQVNDQTVVWTRFAQPHRPRRDYSSFGPFRFARSQYDAAIASAALAQEAS